MAPSCWWGPCRRSRAEAPWFCELSGPSQCKLGPFRGPVIFEDPSDPNPEPFCGSLVFESFSTQPHLLFLGSAVRKDFSNLTFSVGWFCGI